MDSTEGKDDNSRSTWAFAMLDMVATARAIVLRSMFALRWARVCRCAVEGWKDDAERLSFIYTHAKAGFMRIPKRSAQEELCKGKMAFIEAQAVNLPS